MTRAIMGRTAALALAALSVADVAKGQQGRPGDLQVPAATAGVSAELERARDAQRSFERTRRRHFPRGLGDPAGCDEHIGRFCLNHDDADDHWTPEAEAAEVVAARRWLLATLDSVASVAGDDEWLLGQRLKYRLEAGRQTEALALLESCKAPQVRCGTLTGFALNSIGRYAEAEAAFDRSLAEMSPADRCAWTDLSAALDSRERTRYRELECGGAARRAFHRSFWHLADPLWLVRGRERRSEHLARRVRSTLETDVASGYGLPWGDDIAEITIRYGWPAGWDVAWRRVPGVRTERAIQAHRLPEAQWFPVTDFLGQGEDPRYTWALESPHPRTSWASAFGKVHDLPHQVAAFWRGETRVIVAAFDAPPELGSCPVESGLFLANAFEVLARAEGQGTLPLDVGEPPPIGSATLVGLETRCREGPGVARFRAALPPSGRLLSDLLLLDPAPELPATLEAALVRARRSSIAHPGESVVVYWEWYAPPEPTSALSITLSFDARRQEFLA